MKINNLIFIFLTIILLAACSQSTNKADRFKNGNFEIPAGDTYGKTIIIRKDTLQIELYEKRMDSLSIHWKDNFNYTLQMLNPKREIDKDPIHVRITGLKEKSYDFEAVIGHSNFKQKGTIYILEKEE